MAVSKVIYGSQTLIDLTSDTVTEDTLLMGTTAHDAAGNSIVGTIDSLSDFTDDLGNDPDHYHSILKPSQYGSTLPASGVEGQLFFLIE